MSARNRWKKRDRAMSLKNASWNVLGLGLMESGPRWAGVLNAR
ncbi:hypothetical protein [Microcoleus sp.]